MTFDDRPESDTPWRWLWSETPLSRALWVVLVVVGVLRLWGIW